MRDSIRFFEIWTNFAILVVCIGVAVGRTSESFLSRHSTISAVSSYVFLMFALSPIYRRLPSPEFEPCLLGLFLLWWIVFSDHGGLRYRDALQWIGLPASYCILTLVRGDMMAYMPYSERGLYQTYSTWLDIMLSALMSFGVVCLFAYLAGLIIIFLDKVIARLEFPS